MLSAIFFGTTVICAVGWFTRYVSSAALVKYILDKGYAEPSDEELRACTTYVIKRMLHVR